jgi:hypothetical protein
MKKISSYILISFISLSAKSQIEGDIIGKDGKALPKIMIVATDSLTKKTDTVWSDRRGFYFFPALKPGKYELQANIEGFERFVSKYIIVTLPPPNTDEGSDTYYAVRYDIILKIAKVPD